MTLKTNAALGKKDTRNGPGRKLPGQEPMPGAQPARPESEGSAVRDAAVEASLEKIAGLMQDVMELMTKIEENQKAADERAADNARQLERASSQLRRASEFFSDERRSVRNEVAVRTRNEVGAACSEAAEAAKGEIAELAAATRDQIKAYEAESRERTQRLMKVVLPERVFNKVKWVAVVIVILLGLTILVKMWV